ncbi:hypothetical protein [Algoriphagus machipongonensis]|uniref:Uncharacterized protein n=1 Tax=Algoriphagus machipongonensis TaxID=388413 RepID=A3HZR3_9BACT|nr:hypothetical protein [Algoriphagus machipongonensis]EAZ80749.1 hypothetical protein ALPR1_07485 [Algoriphagus machipongonensis]
MFHFKAFRAIDEPERCQKFVQGHSDVLKQYGVTKVTSSNNDWVNNPFVYVVTVENEETSEVVSGLRIHIAHPDFPLPMEQAVSQVDHNIFQLVKDYSKEGTGEVSGLWNSKSISGYGIGAVLLIRAGIAIATQLKLGSLLALVAEYTLKPSLQKGFEIETGVGNSGTFFYPKLDLVATSIVMKDPEKLPLADASERERIFELREKVQYKKIEEGPKGKFEVDYDLLIENINWRDDV